MFHKISTGISNGCSSFQILLDLCSVLSIEAFQLLVEFHISLVDIINTFIFVKGPPATVFGPLFNPAKPS